MILTRFRIDLPQWSLHQEMKDLQNNLCGSHRQSQNKISLSLMSWAKHQIKRNDKASMAIRPLTRSAYQMWSSKFVCGFQNLRSGLSSQAHLTIATKIQLKQEM